MKYKIFLCDLNVAASLSGAEYETADTTETVNTYFNHDFLKLKLF